MATEHYRAFLYLGKEAGFMGPELAKWVKEQVDDLARKRGKKEWNSREKELKLEKSRRENGEAMAIQQASNPTPAAVNALISSINSLVPRWTEEEPEAWLEEIEWLFENYNSIETEKALVLAKHIEGKAKAALCSLEKSQRGDMVKVRRVIMKAYEIPPEKWRQQFRGLAKGGGWTWTEWACHETQSGTCWFNSLSCTTFEYLLNRTTLEEFSNVCLGPLLCISVISNPPHLWKPANGLPNKPKCTHCKKLGHTESDCHYKLGNNKQPSTNNQNSSPSMSTKPSPPTVIAGHRAPAKGSCQSCGAAGHYSDRHPACPNHVPATKFVNLISTSFSVARLQKILHPKRLDKHFISVVPLNGSSLPVTLPVMVDIAADFSLISRAQVPASATIDEQTRWEVKWIGGHTKTVLTVKL
ncbi:uncharacterized protein [Macrobrachium rosenbergii]|uniref:uncharacterized protein n=1 Tax=Macrobrachium rosenbergii TaxID=79674 RepID=UPI0034D4E144